MRPAGVYIAGMRRRPWVRVVASVTGLWFLFLVDGPGPHNCALHDGVAHAGMAHGDMTHGAPNGSKAPKQCSCMGTCCSVAVLNVPSGRLVSLPVVPVAVVATVTDPTSRIAPRAAPDVLLPPPLGPPSLRV